MDTSVPSVAERRVHVVPLGYERDRIVEPLRRHGADAAYFLVDAPDREGARGDVDFDAATAADPADARVDPDELTDYQRDAWTAVAEFAEVRPVPVALADVYDVLGVTTTISARHRADAADGDRLFGNVSTGPRIAAVGVAMACMIVGRGPTASSSSATVTTPARNRSLRASSAPSTSRSIRWTRQRPTRSRCSAGSTTALKGV